MKLWNQFTFMLAASLLCVDEAKALGAPPLYSFPTIQADAVGNKLAQTMIWTHSVENRSGVAVAFRKTFDLPKLPRHAWLNLFADARYILWVDGNYVERGPARFQPNGPEYDVINLAPYLRAGKNVVALLVVGNLSGGKVMRHVPGLTALLQVDGKECWQTDESWKWSEQTRFKKITASWADLRDAEIDARVEDGDWARAEYNDAAWKFAAPIDGSAWGPLTARRIPLLRESPVPFSFSDHVILPVTLSAGQKLEFNAGRIVQAYPIITLDAEAGTELALEPFGVRYLARAGRQTQFTIDTCGLSHGEIAVKTGKVTIIELKLIERLYPYERVGSFTCSDPFLNRLWDMCARSCEVLSEDSYVDCADRERVEWMDDTPPGFDITQTAMAGPAGADGKPVFSDPRLLEELIRRTALTLQPDGWVKAHTCSDRYDIHAKMEDRACDWIDGVRRYYEATGDTNILKEIWPAVVAQMDYFLKHRGDTGLVSARDWVVWGNPLGYMTGQTTTLNVFVQKALADSAFLGGVIGERADSARFAGEADRLSKLINTVLWDEKSGAYFSGYFSDAEVATNAAVKKPLKMPCINGLTPPTLHANVFALDRGVVPPERRDRVIASMLNEAPEKLSGSIMVYYYLMKQMYLLDRLELDERVLDMFRQGWEPMVENAWQCSWEEFQGGSKAHIYGMYPGYLLSSYVLGVRRDAPVWKHQIIIEPHLADLTQAEGVVVTEFGLVKVSWKREREGLRFQINVPANTEAKLALPDKSLPGELNLDGKALPGTVQGSRRVIMLTPGDHSGGY